LIGLVVLVFLRHRWLQNQEVPKPKPDVVPSFQFQDPILVQLRSYQTRLEASNPPRGLASRTTTIEPAGSEKILYEVHTLD